MKHYQGLLIFLFASMSLSATPTVADDRTSADCVILLHGLARSAKSMDSMARALSKKSYRVVNVAYSSRSADIATLSKLAIAPALKRCGDAQHVHFVTHSLGGILLRRYLAHNKIENLGRAVMLGPPNKGSEVVDVYAGWPGVAKFAGPAFVELSAKPQASLPKALGPVDFELAVIAGNRSINPILSCLIPGPDDGKVSVGSSKVAGMSTHVVLPVSHPFMMRNANVIEITYRFLKQGYF